MKETSEIIKLSKIAYLYNSGQMNIVGFSPFSIKAGVSQTYPTSRCAIIIPTSGSGTFAFDERSFVLKRGVMLHGCPHKMLTITASDAADFEYINLYYNADCKELFSIDLKDADQLISILHHILNLSEHATMKHQYQIEALTDQFFELLFSNVLPTSILSETDLVKQTLDYIHAHYQESLTLQQLADYSGISPQKISYLFQKHLGVRPINYLIDYRIQKSIQLLIHSTDTIEAVAAEVGYSDALYFSRIFKKRMGFPPSRIKC